MGEEYVLVYDFYNDGRIRKIAQKIAREKKLKIHAICPMKIPYANKNYVCSRPETFVSLIKNASYVVSNSFHGTAFAMIYGKPFEVVDRPDGLNVRMHDLLERHAIL